MDFTLEDPSEWPIPELEEIDFRLRCPICKEFLQTAMFFPNCSHNFCSLCIRRSLQLEHICPVCRESAQENQLKNNLTLDGIVQAFTSCRAKVLSIIKSKDEATESTFTSETISEETHATRSQQTQRNENPSESSDSSAFSEPIDSKDPIGRSELQKLPKLCYNIMTDKQLRKVLKELGIPSHGDKAAMQRRHTEYLNLYNANCDSTNLKSTATLLKELRNWEKIHGSRSPQSKSFKNVSQDELLAHAEKYSSEFDKLIQSATPKRKEAPVGDVAQTKRQCSSAVIEDDETDLEDASHSLVEEVIKFSKKHPEPMESTPTRFPEM
ncbi:hypothetical protein K493DRAFT_335740 [Basidiobolus meristosporus CBS 931.73]|uniref:Postreplication repair E3 ubiquitin-protein ligase RAD18 n=1 Tax=Basidiobolus meristosporus CBS 931.73 TaxID=1314790 RepID=A0A1Y1YNV7_9FUNG|nr:hypothetical protein K493DRAFT_335740 [Basidiobolus meristosporus CBS 931.73]|eukprot:ORX99446.1 hypothetical protein K493DRAFT_335740 [Basidiobolus meristosporus CBS 931.73]